MLAFLLLTSCTNAQISSDYSSDTQSQNSSISDSKTTSSSIINSSTINSSTTSIDSSTKNSSSSDFNKTDSVKTTTTTTSTKPVITNPPKTTTTIATTTAPPAQIVVPTIYVPTSPGTEVYSSNGAIIDVSNKSKGYFTAKYTGTESSPCVYVCKDSATFFYNLNSQGKAEVFPLQAGNGTYTIIVGNLLSGSQLATTLEKNVNVSISNSLSPFLYPNQVVNFSQSSACVYKSAEVCAGKNTDIEKIGAIFKYVTSNIAYDTAEANAVIAGTIKNYIPDPDEVLRTKKGICYDYASLFAAMTRAQGIPTKLVKGYLGPDGLYHAWNEVYTNSTGWITVEIKATPGYNTLDPTFYAGVSNKQSVVQYFNDANYYKVHKVF